MKLTKAARLKRIRKAVKRVNKRAYKFKPSIMMEVAIDPANQTVMVTNVGKILTGPILREFEKALAHEAKLLMTKIRAEAGQALGRACHHPRHRIKTKEVMVDSETTKIVRLCTKCGCVMDLNRNYWR